MAILISIAFILLVVVVTWIAETSMFRKAVDVIDDVSFRTPKSSMITALIFSIAFNVYTTLYDIALISFVVGRANPLLVIVLGFLLHFIVGTLILKITEHFYKPFVFYSLSGTLKFGASAVITALAILKIFAKVMELFQ